MSERLSPVAFIQSFKISSHSVTYSKTGCGQRYPSRPTTKQGWAQLMSMSVGHIGSFLIDIHALTCTPSHKTNADRPGKQELGRGMCPLHGGAKPACCRTSSHGRILGGQGQHRANCLRNMYVRARVVYRASVQGINFCRCVVRLSIMTVHG